MSKRDQSNAQPKRARAEDYGRAHRLRDRTTGRLFAHRRHGSRFLRHPPRRSVPRPAPRRRRCVLTRPPERRSLALSPPAALFARTRASIVARLRPPLTLPPIRVPSAPNPLRAVAQDKRRHVVSTPGERRHRRGGCVPPPDVNLAASSKSAPTSKILPPPRPSHGDVLGERHAHRRLGGELRLADGVVLRHQRLVQTSSRPSAGSCASSFDLVFVLDPRSPRLSSRRRRFTKLAAAASTLSPDLRPPRQACSTRRRSLVEESASRSGWRTI